MKSKKGESKKPNQAKQAILLVGGLIVLVGLILGSVWAYGAAVPEHYREPVVAHHHMRMQLIIDGEYIDFSKDPYQEPYTEGQCSDGLTDTPIHFHDQKSQYVHIHWDKITGGEVLKYYGLNRIGGPDDILGYRFDRENFEPIPILTDELPDSNKPIYVYEIKGDEIIKRDTRDFLHQDIETFFDKKSSLTLQREDAAADEVSWLNWGSVPAYAHAGPHNEPDDVEKIVQPTLLKKFDDGEQIIAEESFTQDELKELNDVLGDIIIFIQDDEPNENQVRDRIADFVILESTTCGG